MIFSAPIPFEQALQDRRLRALLPTTLSSDELRTIDAGILRRATFSARVDRVEVLQSIDDLVGQLLNPREEDRAGKKVVEGPNLATAKLELKRAITVSGYEPAPEDRGTIKDLTSDARRKLILRTNVQTAQGFGQYEQGMQDGARDAMPLWELIRFEGRKVPRVWQQRWLEAARFVGDDDAVRVFGETQRMLARKDSPIWEALGSKDIFEDALGNPYAPFAFNSGMGVIARDRDLAVKLGFMKPADKIERNEVQYDEDLEAHPQITSAALRSVLTDLGYGFDDEGVLTLSN